MPIDSLKELWLEFDEAAMNDREYDRDDEARREEVREPEWDSAREMEDGE